MEANLFKSKKINAIVIITLTVLIGFYKLYTSVEYSMYKVLSNLLSYNAEPANTSTKCLANTDFINNLDPTDKMMFMALFNIKEVREKQTCQEFLASEYSLIGGILSDIRTNDSEYKQKFALLEFVIKKETSYGGATYGFSYKCKDNDTAEKVCSISNNDDSYEDLYFKKVNAQWVLSKVEQRSL